jgi:phage baseplate assembly protein W
MAYKTIELNNPGALDQQVKQRSHFYKGFSSLDNSSSNTQLYDFDLIKQDILNHFNTKKGERLMNPTFGSSIWDLLMEPLTEQVRDALKEDINRICTFDPRVYPSQMDLTEYSNGYLLELTLVMKNTNQSINMKLTFDQTIGLTVQ